MMWGLDFKRDVVPNVRRCVSKSSVTKVGAAPDDCSRRHEDNGTQV